MRRFLVLSLLSVGTAYGVRAIPTTVVIDAEGIIRCRRRGVLNPGELDPVLRMVREDRLSVPDS
jgi:hypothetical protein